MNIWNKVELIKESNLLPQGWIALVLIGFGIYYLVVYLCKIPKTKQYTQLEENLFKFIVLLVFSVGVLFNLSYQETFYVKLGDQSIQLTKEEYLLLSEYRHSIIQEENISLQNLIEEAKQNTSNGSE